MFRTTKQTTLIDNNNFEIKMHQCKYFIEGGSVLTSVVVFNKKINTRSPLSLDQTSLVRDHIQPAEPCSTIAGRIFTKQPLY